MKTLFEKVLFTLAILSSVFIIGIFIPMIISLFITITTDATLQDCIQTGPFILFSAIGIIISACYINEEVLSTI